MLVGGEMFTENPHERFPCAVCGKSYLRKRHLQRHMRDECIGIPPRFSCDLCPSRFRRKYHMVRHLTSKHGIPPAIAQQTTSSSHHGGSGSGGGYRSCGENSVGGGLNNANDCDGSAPENLSLKKAHYETNNAPHSPHGPAHVNGGGGGGGGDIDGDACAANADMKPTYGLTGAITAISAAAVIGDSIGNGKTPDATMHEEIAHSLAGSVVVDDDKIAGQLAANKAMNAIGEDWKMKLGIQLISNSLLKERLINTMPFAYNNNN
ncbi:uncharacterized protein LOC118743494 [Rhagoletis pomonella]|uniref:uncharacterized protein LOC118743494 n=1 Tax=Rhagoletis pomonella TaxID=28610 RepID=UPI00177C90A3|nr:uncharacterized protein LOC118743494 [Rhagoletis pomonella]XP_036332110.1 uncharacterized protein LOC118743494 [Rhagoletis pomonella]